MQSYLAAAPALLAVLLIIIGRVMKHSSSEEIRRKLPTPLKDHSDFIICLTFGWATKQAFYFGVLSMMFSILVLALLRPAPPLLQIVMLTSFAFGILSILALNSLALDDIEAAKHPIGVRYSSFFDGSVVVLNLAFAFLIVAGEGNKSA